MLQGRPEEERATAGVSWTAQVEERLKVASVRQLRTSDVMLACEEVICAMRHEGGVGRVEERR